jgi:hypothetical protein
MGKEASITVDPSEHRCNVYAGYAVRRIAKNSLAAVREDGVWRTVYVEPAAKREQTKVRAPDLHGRAKLP